MPFLPSQFHACVPILLYTITWKYSHDTRAVYPARILIMLTTNTEPLPFTSFSSWRVLQAAGSLSFCLLFKSPNANTNSKALTILHSRSLNTLLGWKTKYNFGYYTLYKTNCQRCVSGVLVKTLQTSQSWAYILHLGYGQCHTTSACLLFIHCLFEPQSVGVYW